MFNGFPCKPVQMDATLCWPRLYLFESKRGNKGATAPESGNLTVSVNGLTTAQTARRFDRYHADNIPPMLDAVVKAGHTEAFRELLADSLADAEASRRAALLVLDPYPEQVESMAEWVAKTLTGGPL